MGGQNRKTLIMAIKRFDKEDEVPEFSVTFRKQEFWNTALFWIRGDIKGDKRGERLGVDAMKYWVS